MDGRKCSEKYLFFSAYLTAQHKTCHDLNVLPPIADPVNRIYRKLDLAHNYFTINWILCL